jgi:hypothetical protein
MIGFKKVTIQKNEGYNVNLICKAPVLIRQVLIICYDVVLKWGGDSSS